MIIIGNGTSYANTGQRFPQRPMRATAPPQPRNARSSPYPEQFGVGQQFAQQTISRPQQRMAVPSLPSPMRVNSPRFANETSLPSPNFQTVSYQQSSDQFTFEQTFSQNNSQPNDRTRNNSGMTSEYVRQELRTLVSGRTQQQQQQLQQQTPQQQQISQLSSQSLTQADLEMFGLFSDTSDDITQGLLNISADTNAGVNSPVSHHNLNMNRSNSMVRIRFHSTVKKVLLYLQLWLTLIQTLF